MSDAFKILGQADPGGSAVVLYTVPEIAETLVGNAAIVTSAKASSLSTKTIVSSIMVCNRHTASVTYTIRLKRGATFIVEECSTAAPSSTLVTLTKAGTDTSSIPVGAVMSGTGITAGSVVSSIVSSTTFNMDQSSASAQADTDISFRVNSDMEYLFYQVPLPSKKTHILSLGLTLDAGNLIEVTSGTANKLSFTAMGIEVT